MNFFIFLKVEYIFFLNENQQMDKSNLFCICENL